MTKTQLNQEWSMGLMEAIESEAQWQALEGLGVDGAQGYHLGRPG